MPRAAPKRAEAAVVVAAVRRPWPLLTAVVAIAMMSVRLVFHLTTLPVEWDASFGKALPILEQGDYLSKQDLPAIRQVLKAAALTYVAGALMDILRFWRWIRFLR